jgi:hypothetical protein
MEAGNLVEKVLDQRLAPFNLSTVQFRVLLHLSLAKDGVTPSALARLLSQEVQSVSALIDRLEERNLVKRMRHPLDRRSVTIEITPEGEGHILSAGGGFVEGSVAFREALRPAEDVLVCLERVKAAAHLSSSRGRPVGSRVRQ